MRRQLKRPLGFIKKHWRLILVWGFSGFFVLCGLVALWAATLRIPDLSSLQSRVVEQSLKIYDTIYDIAQRSEKIHTPTYRVADMIVEEKLAAVAPPPMASKK